MVVPHPLDKPAKILRIPRGLALDITARSGSTGACHSSRSPRPDRLPPPGPGQGRKRQWGKVPLPPLANGGERGRNPDWTGTARTGRLPKFYLESTGGGSRVPACRLFVGRVRSPAGSGDSIVALPGWRGGQRCSTAPPQPSDGCSSPDQALATRPASGARDCCGSWI